MTFGGMLLGPLEKLGGFNAMFVFAALTITVSSLIGFALGRDVGGCFDRGTETAAPSRAHPEMIDLDGLT